MKEYELKEIRYQKRWEQSHVRFKRRMKRKFKEKNKEEFERKRGKPRLMFNWKDQEFI